MLPVISTYRNLSAAASDNAALVQAGETTLRSIIGYNAAAAGRYLKLYDKVSAPTSSDTPVMTIYLPATAAFALDFQRRFALGLGIRITTGGPDNDTGALTAADILGLNIGYR